MDLRQAVQDFFTAYYSLFDEPDTPKIAAKETWEKLLKMAANDTVFRQQLIRSPLQTLTESGFQLPRGLRIAFIEDTPDTIYVPIPPFIGVATPEAENE